MADDYGTCWSCTFDLTMPAVMVGGFRVVAEAIVRRWSTPRGALIDDPNYGIDLRDYISDDLGKGELARIASLAQAEAEKDERVLSCAVAVTFNAGVLTVTGAVTLVAGETFDLVVRADQTSVTLLRAA